MMMSLLRRSTVKVHTQPRSPKDHACDVVNYLSSVLFPPGISNAPIEQLQQFYGAAVANRMVSANAIEKRNLANSSSAVDNGLFISVCRHSFEDGGWGTVLRAAVSGDILQSQDISRPSFDVLGLENIRDALRSDGHRCRKCKHFLIKQA